MTTDIEMLPDGILLCAFCGDIDTVTSSGAEEAVMSNISRSSKWLVDLSGVGYVSSAGLRVLLLLAKELQKQNGAMALCGLNETVAEIFEISGFSLIFDIFPDRGKAAEHLG